MLKKCLVSLLLLISTAYIAQPNPNLRRSWYVGYYQGMLKDSSVNITIPCSFNIYNTQSYPNTPYPLDDSTITIQMGGSWEYIVCMDSTIQTNGNRYCTDWPNTYGYAKLKADSSFMFMITSIGGCVCSASVGSNHCDPGDWMVFRGKKTTDIIISIFENDLESNSAAVFPNPAQEHINVLTFMEFDAMELYDILGKNYKVTLNKTSNGYHIDLPEGMSSGIYFLRMRRGNESLTKKVFVKQGE